MKKFKFSFFELLLIFAVTAIFAGVLIPVLQAAQQAQKKASCADQSRIFNRLSVCCLDNSTLSRLRKKLSYGKTVIGNNVISAFLSIL